jgi:hypothetical protein
LDDGFFWWDTEWTATGSKQGLVSTSEKTTTTATHRFTWIDEIG